MAGHNHDFEAAFEVFNVNNRLLFGEGFIWEDQLVCLIWDVCVLIFSKDLADEERFQDESVLILFQLTSNFDLINLMRGYKQYNVSKLAIDYFFVYFGLFSFENDQPNLFGL